MTGLLTAAGIADNYGLVLFVHLSALLGAISAGRSPIIPSAIRTTETLAGIRTSVGVLSKVEKAFPIALTLLVGTGAYLVQHSWTWRSGWVEASLAAVAVLLLNGGIVVKGRSRALRHELARTHADRPTTCVLELARKHIATVASWLNTGLALGIVFFHDNEAPPRTVDRGLAVAATAGATVGLHLRGKAAGQMPDQFPTTAIVLGGPTSAQRSHATSSPEASASRRSPPTTQRKLRP